MDKSEDSLEDFSSDSDNYILSNETSDETETDDNSSTSSSDSFFMQIMKQHYNQIELKSISTTIPYSSNGLRKNENNYL